MRRELARRKGCILKCDVKKYFDNIDHDRLKYILRECLGRMRLTARCELKLEFNEKTQIFPISEGVDYLGWRFYLAQSGKVIRRLRTSNKKRFKRRLKYFQEAYRRGETDFEAVSRSLASYNGHLSPGVTEKRCVVKEKRMNRRRKALSAIMGMAVCLLMLPMQADAVGG